MPAPEPFASRCGARVSIEARCREGHESRPHDIPGHRAPRQAKLDYADKVTTLAHGRGPASPALADAAVPAGTGHAATSAETTRRLAERRARLEGSPNDGHAWKARR